jgi:hypothetical protein
MISMGFHVLSFYDPQTPSAVTFAIPSLLKGLGHEKEINILAKVEKSGGSALMFLIICSVFT